MRVREGRGFIAVADNGGAQRFEVLKLVADLVALSETLVLDALFMAS